MTEAPYVALITGSNRGIGIEFVRQYADAGYRVIACCRDPAASALKVLADAGGGRISVHALDVGDLGQIERLATELKGQPIDLLINNAGFYPPDASAGPDYAAWQQAFAINTMAPLRMAECFVEQLAASRLRRLVTLSSTMGSVADNSSGGSMLYRASKSAVNMVMKNLAIGLKSKRIAALTLHPGWVRTAMGGANALITPEQSVSGMRAVIDQLTLENSGRFVAYDGVEIPW